jgi:hypothetical protein
MSAPLLLSLSTVNVEIEHTTTSTHLHHPEPLGPPSQSHQSTANLDS